MIGPGCNPVHDMVDKGNNLVGVTRQEKDCIYILGVTWDLPCLTRNGICWV